MNTKAKGWPPNGAVSGFHKFAKAKCTNSQRKLLSIVQDHWRLVSVQNTAKEDMINYYYYCKAL